MYDAPKRRLYYCSRRLCQSSLPKAVWEVQNLQSRQRNSKGVQRTLLNRLQTHQKRSKKNPEDACNLSKTPPRRCQEQPGKRTPGKSEFSRYAPHQSRQRVPKRPPENPPKAPPDAPKRFESSTERRHGNGQPRKLDFLRMYRTELQVLEMPSSYHNPPKTNRNDLGTLSG